MKKFLLGFTFLPLFLFVAAPAFADSFDVSNVSFDGTTLSFDVSPTLSYTIQQSFSGSPQGVRICNNTMQNCAWGSTNFSATCLQTGHCSGTYEYDPDAGVAFGSYDQAHIVVYLDSGPWVVDSNQTFDYSSYFTPAPEVKIVSSPTSGSKTVGQPFSVDVRVEDEGEAFNAARATVAVSSNLEILGINNPSSNACNLHYTTTPSTGNPSFAGAIYGGSSEGCTVYTMTLRPTESGTGTVTFTNGSIKAYSDNSEILTGVTNASFTLGDGPTPTPTPMLEFQVTSPLQTYKTNYDLAGTKLSTITHIFVNGSDEDSTYPTGTTWSVPLTLSLGNNNYTLYGSDDEDNQTATQTVTVDRHILGDINGDGEIDLIDASLFAVDWDKTEDLTYVLSDMNDDGVVDLTDLSILAKLQD